MILFIAPNEQNKVNHSAGTCNKKKGARAWQHERKRASMSTTRTDEDAHTRSLHPLDTRGLCIHSASVAISVPNPPTQRSPHTRNAVGAAVQSSSAEGTPSHPRASEPLGEARKRTCPSATQARERLLKHMRRLNRLSWPHFPPLYCKGTRIPRHL